MLGIVETWVPKFEVERQTTALLGLDGARHRAAPLDLRSTERCAPNMGANLWWKAPVVYRARYGATPRATICRASSITS